MSMHAIEDLVEDTVRWVDSVNLPPSEKRSWLSNLFTIQERFDTSYTHFRVMDVLLQYGSVYKLPLAVYEQKASPAKRIRKDNAAQEAGWVKAGTGEAAPLAYLQTEAGTEFLYFDAGSDVWRYACDLALLPEPDHIAPDVYPPAEMIARLLVEMEKQKAFHLLQAWYAFFVNAVLERDFGAAEGIPATFDLWLANDTLLLIRSIGQRNDPPKKKREDDDMLALPSLAEELRLLTTADDIYRTRFLLDLKKTLDKLAAGYKKDSRPAADPDKKKGLIFEKAEAYLRPKGWTYTGAQEPHRWVWYKDAAGTPQSHRLFIMLQLEPDDKSLFCKLALQHGLLLQWQQVEPGALPEQWHFHDDIYSSLPAAFKEGNKNMNDWGAWKFDVKQTGKALAARMDNVLEGIAQAGDAWYENVLGEFPERYFTRKPDRLLHVLEEGEGDSGIIPDYVLFGSKYHILLAFVFHHLEKGEKTKAAPLMEQAKAFANTGRINGTLREKVLAPVFEQWDRGEPLVYPPVWHVYLLRSAWVQENEAKRRQG